MQSMVWALFVSLQANSEQLILKCQLKTPTTRVILSAGYKFKALRSQFVNLSWGNFMKINGSIIDQNTDDDFDEYYDSTCDCYRGPSFIAIFVVGMYALIEWVLKAIFAGIAIMPETRPSGDPIGIRLINAYKARKNRQPVGDLS
jgi:hypothetical protein